jgi:hypothetical protein
MGLGKKVIDFEPSEIEVQAQEASMKFIMILILGWTILSSAAWAGVFNMPHFVSPDRSVLGIEPEAVLTSGGGVGMNLRYTHGLSESSNLTGIVGTGSGPRGFRLGAAMTFDVFPDAASQPGVGFGAQGLLVQLTQAAALELTGFPYIHKRFPASEAQRVIAMEPFLALPIGLGLTQGSYRMITSLSIGSLFEHNEHFKSIVELTMGLSGSETILSGGVSYYP